MDNSKKMLRAIINGQSALKEELLKKIDGVETKLSGRIDSLEKKMAFSIKNVNKRIDRLGKSLAYLEDDAPTREEHDELEKRVTKIEHKIASI